MGRFNDGTEKRAAVQNVVCLRECPALFYLLRPYFDADYAGGPA